MIHKSITVATKNCLGQTDIQAKRSSQTLSPAGPENTTLLIEQILGTFKLKSLFYCINIMLALDTNKKLQFKINYVNVLLKKSSKH